MKTENLPEHPGNLEIPENEPTGFAWMEAAEVEHYGEARTMEARRRMDEWGEKALAYNRAVMGPVPAQFPPEPCWYPMAPGAQS